MRHVSLLARFLSGFFSRWPLRAPKELLNFINIDIDNQNTKSKSLTCLEAELHLQCDKSKKLGQFYFPRSFWALFENYKNRDLDQFSKYCFHEKYFKYK